MRIKKSILQNTIRNLILLCALCSSAYAKADESSSDNKQIHFKVVSLPNEDMVLDELWNIILTNAKTSEVTSEEKALSYDENFTSSLKFLKGQNQFDKYVSNKKIVRIFLNRLSEIFKQLKTNHRIAFYRMEENPLQNASDFNLNCQNSDQCQSTKAFYLPLSNMIYIKEGPAKKDLAQALFHELIHAYQFIYRLPLDLLSTIELIEGGSLRPENAYEFLLYFYESQANYYSMRLAIPPAWKDIVSKQRMVLDTGTSVFVAYVFPWLAAVHGISKDLLNKKIAKALPDVDKFRFLNDISAQYNGVKGSLLPNELSIQAHSTIPFTSQWNPGFHWHISRAIERVYFGKRDSIFREGMPSSAGFNHLHNQYYKNIGLNEFFDENPDCTKLVNGAQTSASPTLYWMLIDSNDFTTCPAFESISNYFSKKKVTNFTELFSPVLSSNNSVLQDPLSDKELLKFNDPSQNGKKFEANKLEQFGRSIRGQNNFSNSNSKSPFFGTKPEGSGDKNALKIGGEGTTPDMPVLPAYPVLPQMEVQPDIVKDLLEPTPNNSQRNGEGF